MMKRQSTVSCKRPALAQTKWSCLASVQDRRLVPVVEDTCMETVWQGCLIGFICWIRDAQLDSWFTKTWKSQPSETCLQEVARDSLANQSAHSHLQEGPACTGLSQRVEEVSAGREPPLNYTKAHQIKTTSWSNDNPHPEFKHAFSRTPPMKFNFQQSHMRRSFHRDNLASLPGQITLPHALPQDTLHGTASPHGELTQPKTNHST